MENNSTTIEMTLSQESADAIVKAVSDVMFDLLNDFLIPLREEVQEIESNTPQNWILKIRNDFF